MDYLQAFPYQEDSEADVVGINALLLHYRAMRKAKYQLFLGRWEALEEVDFKHQFLKTVSSRKN